MAEAMYAGESLESLLGVDFPYEFVYFYEEAKPWWALENERKMVYEKFSDMPAAFVAWMNRIQLCNESPFKYGITFEGTGQILTGSVVKHETRFHVYVPPWYYKITETADLMRSLVNISNESQWADPLYLLRLFGGDLIDFDISFDDYQEYKGHLVDLFEFVRQQDDGSPIEVFLDTEMNFTCRTETGTKRWLTS